MQLKEKVDATRGEEEKRRIYAQGKKELEEQLGPYNKALNDVNSDNNSNLHFLTEMYEFLKEKSPAKENEVLPFMETHKLERVAA